MPEELDNFLKDLFLLVQEKYYNSLSEESRLVPEADVAFRLGANLAYHDVLELIRSQIKAFGYEEAVTGFVVPELGRTVHGTS